MSNVVNKPEECFRMVNGNLFIGVYMTDNHKFAKNLAKSWRKKGLQSRIQVLPATDALSERTVILLPSNWEDLCSTEVCFELCQYLYGEQNYVPND